MMYAYPHYAINAFQKPFGFFETLVTYCCIQNIQDKIHFQTSQNGIPTLGINSSNHPSRSTLHPLPTQGRVDRDSWQQFTHRRPPPKVPILPHTRI
ncbi:hypothetical protein CEXT_681041 [Caerostris extrusa]|uniref:Uncharacterized protein n=1 Tax=Caerostris extrusa TaxID=172846 RepID=A0AAV4WRC2_CAEEX|nr:hypothetical protein CEXT_681041 [Caerostris extrusa]